MGVLCELEGVYVYVYVREFVLCTRVSNMLISVCVQTNVCLCVDGFKGVNG